MKECSHEWRTFGTCMPVIQRLMSSKGFALLTEAKILQPDNLRRWVFENWDELVPDENEPDFICLMCETCGARARVNDYTDSEWDEAVWTPDDIGTLGDIWEDESRVILMSEIKQEGKAMVNENLQMWQRGVEAGL